MRFSKSKVAELIDLGYGQNHLRRYKPFLRLGRGWFIPHATHSWTWNPILQRHHDIFSRGEKDALVFSMWAGAKDGREQMPCWHVPWIHPLADAPFPRPKNLRGSIGTIELAKNAGIRHPLYFGTRDYLVVTVDLMATFLLPEGPRLVAIPTKYKEIPGEDRSEYRQLELLELQRRYAVEVGALFAPWIHSPEFSPFLANLRSLFPYAILNERLHASRYNDFVNFARERLRDAPMRVIRKQAALRLKLSVEDVGPLWNHALWRQDLAVDLREPFIESYVAPQWSLEERTGLQTALLH